MADINKFSIPAEIPSPKPSKPQIILQEFGLTALRTKLFTKNSQPQDQAIATSYLGTPVFSNLTFEPGSYTKDGQTFNYDGIVLETVLLDVTITKNVVKTAIEGRDGTVKEFISMGDYQVDIRGALVSQNANQYPLTEMNKLIKICQVPDAVKVTSAFLKLFGIYYLVIDPQAQFPQSEGKLNTQIFRISSVSDTPLELQKNA